MQKSHLTAFPPLYVFSILNQIFFKKSFEVLYFSYRNEQVTLPFSFGSVQGLFLNVKGPLASVLQGAAGGLSLNIAFCSVA